MTNPATEQPAAEKARLERCPFCGGKGQIVDDLIDPENESAGSIFHAVCQNDSIHCPMQPGIYACDTAEIAAKAWNTRAQSAAFDALEKAVREVEWIGGQDRHCPGCGNYELPHKAHHPECSIRAALAQLEELRKGATS